MAVCPPLGGWLETDPTWVTSEDEDSDGSVPGYVLDANLWSGWKGSPRSASWRLTFDLQTSVTLSRIRIWKYGGALDVTVSRFVSSRRQWNVVTQQTGVELSHSHATELRGFRHATAQDWRLQFADWSLSTQITEVEFFQACSGFDMQVCTDGNCDVYEVLCDEIVDCDDFSDESNCTNPTSVSVPDDRCTTGEKTCSNGNCVGLSEVCDGTDHCGDGSDELACPVGACRNGGVFHLSTRCDGLDDCGDNSDEQNCNCYYLQDKGTSYRGRSNRDGSCQFWTSQYPHSHNHTPEAYPSAGLEQNYCRNPDGKDRPWCYTNNPFVRWMYCADVFACDAKPTRCFYASDNGKSYAGHINRAGGRVCQRWDSQSPHSHPHTPQAHPDAGLEENFCRNPDNKERPWCYTTDVVWRWSYCDVMECQDPTSVSVPDGRCRLPIHISCKERCGIHYVDAERCNCDKDCRVFGDCCKDFEEVCSDIAEMTPDHRDKKWRCVPGFFKGTSSWLVGDCPDDWADDVTRQQCIKDVDSFNPSDLTYRMPVQEVSTSVPYKNIFCAFCNNISLADVVAWDSTVECTGLITSSTHTAPNTQVYHTIIGNDTECLGINRLAFVNPYSRKCFYHEVDSSSINCNESACMSYRLYMKSGYGSYHHFKPYNNIHCALCEGMSPAAVTELTPCTFYGGSVHNCFPNCISLTHLFNFDDDDDKSSSSTHCPLGSVYDPFVDTCRLLKDDQTTDGPANKSVSLQNCSEPALSFTAEEFHVLPNGSVHLLSSNVTCPAEQVAIQNTSALVCGECILQYFSNHTRGGETTNPWEADQGYLTLGLVVVSAVAVVAFVVYSARPEQWKKMSGKLKVQMILCMTIAESLFVGRVLVDPGPACIGLAILLHYLLLASFSSMNALALDLFLTFRQHAERASLRKYMLYTWLMPVLFVGLTAFVDFCPCSSIRVGYGQNACWIGNPIGSLVVFGAPVLCALLVNLVLIIHTLLAIRKSFKIADAALVRSDSSKAWVYLRISFLTGFTWIIGFVLPYAHSRALEYIFIVLNASQGLLLTLLLTLTSDVMLTWMTKIRERFRPSKPRQGAGRRTTATASNQKSSARATKATVAGTNTTDIEMATRGRNTKAKAAAGPKPATDMPVTARVRNTKVKAAGTDPATDIPMKALVRNTEAKVAGADPATDIPMKALVRNTEAKVAGADPATDIPMKALVRNTEAKVAGADPATDIAMKALVRNTEAKVAGADPATDIPMKALVRNTGAKVAGADPATDIPMKALVRNTEAKVAGADPATDIAMKALVRNTEAKVAGADPATDIPMKALVRNTEAKVAGADPATDIPMKALAHMHVEEIEEH
ncbi:uncharacterized protein [Branchiostoma lanceolatum]|uniref:uncharacterized protein n=1 Tax=Branchiostoma lanceolatum TaxID=7740 RepID=UPI003451F528